MSTMFYHGWNLYVAKFSWRKAECLPFKDSLFWQEERKYMQTTGEHESSQVMKRRKVQTTKNFIMWLDFPRQPAHRGKEKDGLVILGRVGKGRRHYEEDKPAAGASHLPSSCVMTFQTYDMSVVRRPLVSSGPLSPKIITQKLYYLNHFLAN